MWTAAAQLNGCQPFFFAAATELPSSRLLLLNTSPHLAGPHKAVLLCIVEPAGLAGLFVT